MASRCRRAASRHRCRPPTTRRRSATRPCPSPSASCSRSSSEPPAADRARSVRAGRGRAREARALRRRRAAVRTRRADRARRQGDGRRARGRDRAGRRRHVPGAVEPMLPQALSNDACSLRPGADRLTVTVEMEMNGADVDSVAFHRSLIRSDARLTYDEVDAVFAGAERAQDPWAEPLAVAREVAAALAERRRQRGSALEVESEEPSFEFDERGDVIAVHHDEQTESHRLIEQLMILANEQVATFLAERKVPTLYRVHERPDPRAVQALAAKLAELDVPTPPLPETMTPQQAADAVGAISRSVADYVRKTGRGQAIFHSLVLRALKQAFYSPQNLGHAGLSSASYCHFTSPIRRYPDLVVHRGLLATLGLDDARPHAAEMDEAGAASSAAE